MSAWLRDWACDSLGAVFDWLCVHVALWEVEEDAEFVCVRETLDGVCVVDAMCVDARVIVCVTDNLPLTDWLEETVPLADIVALEVSVALTERL